MKRSDIYKAIDGERAYQRKVWGENGERRAELRQTNPGRSYVTDDGVPEPGHDIGEWRGYVEHYLALAKAEGATKDDPNAELAMLRKAAALLVACFEQHGVPEREVK
jgi:hypothetical protein